MKKTQAVLAALAVIGLAAAPLAAQAKHHKKHHSSMSSPAAAGSNAANPSSQGNVGPGTNQAGSKTTGGTK